MALKRVGVELEAEQSTAFLKAMENASTAVSGFGAAAVKASSGVDKFDASTRQLKIDDLERKLEGQAGALNILERELDQVATKYGDASIQADKKRLAIANLNRSINSNEAALESQKTALNNAIQAEIRAEQAVNKLGTETAQATTKIEKLGTETIQAANQSERGFKDIGRAADDAKNQIGIFEQILIGSFRRIGEAAIDMSIQGGRALIGLIGDTLSAAGDFEATLNNFASKTGSAMEEAGYDLEDFSAEFLRLGAETKYSAAEAGDAAVELAKGGVDVTTIMGEATEATLNLAAAGGLELAPAATIVAKQLGVWADEGITATDVVDSLAQAANASTVDVDELALGMANAGGTAKVAGVSFQDTVQAMALLAPGFSSAADAGTSFKTFLSRLIPTTKDATGMMIDLGLYTEESGSRFYDATGSFIGMEKATELLYRATKDLTEEQKIQALQTIFGQDAIRAAAILAEGGAESFNAMGSAMGNAGSAAEQATKMNVGYNFAMESLKGSLETVQIILGTLLLPTLTAFINEAVIPGVNAVMEFATALGASADPMGMIVEQLKLGASALSAWVIDSIPSVIGGLATLGQALIEWTISQLPAWSAGLQALGQQAIQWISDSLPGWQAAAAEYLAGLLAWIQASLPGWIESLKTLGAAAIQWIADSAPGWIESATTFFNTMVAWVGERLPGWIESLKQFANAAIQWVIDALPGLGTNLGTFAGTVLAWVVKTTGELIPVIAALAWEFVKWVATDVIPKLPGVLLTIATEIINFIVATAKAVIPELVILAGKFYAWVTDTAIPELGKALPKIYTAITDWITQAAKDTYTAVITIGTNIIAGITQGVIDAAMGLLNAVVGAVEDAWNAVGDFLGIQSPSKLYATAGMNMMLGMAGGILGTQGAVNTALVDGLHGSFQIAISEAATGGLSTGNAFVESFQAAIHGGLDIGDLSSTSDSWIGMPEISDAFGGGTSRIHPPGFAGGAFSGGNTTNQVTNSPSYAINYNGVSSPPPPQQSFAALAAWAG